jgi:hypothetical protein
LSALPVFSWLKFWDKQAAQRGALSLGGVPSAMRPLKVEKKFCGTAEKKRKNEKKNKIITRASYGQQVILRQYLLHGS